MDKFLKIGPFLLAAPMLIFPILHFVYASFVADIIPPWIPWHLFWNYFTALTIFPGGLSILFRKFSYIIPLLLGIEIFLFVVLIHIFLLFHGKGDAWAERTMFGEFPGRVINAFKDFGLSGAVFIFAGTQSESWRETGKDGVFVFGRTIVGLSIAGLGVIHFIYPIFAPGLPPMLNTVPFIFPAEAFWVYLTGAALAIAGILIFAGKASHQLVAWAGLILLLFDLLVWVPQFIINPSDLTGNWLKDLGIIGGVLILAEALPKKLDKTMAV
jgi:uncharacterized membrane protein